jgi:hypothetical protein
MFCAALASPMVARLIAPIASVPPHRVFSRLTMLGVVAITVWLLRRYGLANREVLGYIGPLPRFLRRAAIALAAGAGVMLFTLLPLFALNVRIWNQDTPEYWTGWLPLIAKGLGTGIAVAMIEETFFRGAMQGTLQRMGGMRWALLAVPALYAAVHFIGRPVTLSPGQFGLGGPLAAFAHPLDILDAFIALWCVGLLLALVRRRWGDIAGCIGLHAGFVMTITVFRKASSPAPSGEWSFLVGSFDGLLGWWIAAVTGCVCAALWLASARRFRNC